MNPTIPAFNRLMGFVIDSLPDSIAQRKTVLNDLLVVIPAGHPQRSAVKALLLLLESHEQHQLSLSLDFSKAAAVAAADQPKTKK